MARWRIYYSDSGYVEGTTKREWEDAPDYGVQVVVLFIAPERPRWTYKKGGQNIAVTDRQLWTGEDWYDPFGWGSKEGELISNEEYFSIWAEACSGD